MIRLFIKIYLLIALPLILLFLPPSINPVVKLVEHFAEPHYSQQMAGIFYLVEERLAPLPEDQWPEALKKISKQFSFPLKFLEDTHIQLSNKKKQRLKNGETVVRLPGTTALLKQIPGSGKTLVMYLDVDRDAEDQMILRGPLYLLRQRLENTPPEQWNSFLSLAAKKSSIAIQAKSNNTLPKTVREDEHWQDGEVIREQHENGSYSYVVKSHREDTSYVIGPIDESDFRTTLSLINNLVPATLLALGILVIAWPLWQQIRRLQRTVQSFGEGNLESRIQLSRHSVLQPIAQGFNRMAKKIQGLIQGQKELTRAVSHELRTPLSRLRFELEMLAQAKDEPSRQTLMDGINDDIDELESLVDELLTHSRYEQRQQSPAETLDISQYLGDYITHYRSPYPEPTIGSKCLQTSSPCPVNIPAEGLTRVLNNLLGNALRHCRDKVHISSEEADHHCLIHIDDDGPGVPAAYRKKIFSPFIRLDESRTRDSGGHGLGLAIVERILRAHGGHISVSESPLGKPGEGARFTIMLPKAYENSH